MDAGLIGVLIPIVAITVVGAVSFARILLKHRERMAMIEAGFHPDDPDFDHEPEPERELAAGGVRPALELPERREETRKTRV